MNLWLAPALIALAAPPVQEHSPPIRLNGTLVGGSVGAGFQLTPDGSTVVYTARQDGPSLEVYAVPIDRSAGSVKLSADLVSGGNASTLQVAPDGSRVVYLADQDVDDVHELYSVPVAGSGGPVKLNGALVAEGDVHFSFRIDSTASCVVYLADQEADEVFELYSAPLDGSASAVKLNGLLPAGGDVLHWLYSIAPDGSRVVYVADQDIDEVFELYAAPVDGSAAPTKLNATLALGGDVQNVLVSPDSTRVVYTADQYLDGVVELFGAPIDGSAPPVRINYPLATGDGITRVAVAPDGRRVAYAEQRDSRFWIGTASIHGGRWGLLDWKRVDEVSGLGFSPDSSKVVWDLGDFLGGPHELRSGPNAQVAPGAGVALLASFGYVGALDFEITPDSESVLYHARDTLDGELWSIPIDGSLAPVPVSPTGSYAWVSDFQIDPDGETVVFAGSYDGYGTLEIYRSAVDGTGVPERISGDLARGRRAEVFELATDGRCVVFRADVRNANQYELYSTCELELDGLAPRSGPFRGGTPVFLSGFGFTPGARVFFDGRPAMAVLRLDGSRLIAVTPPLAVPLNRGRAALVVRPVDVVVSDGAARVPLHLSFTYLYR